MSFRVTRFPGSWHGVAALIVTVVAAACGSNDTAPPGSNTGAVGGDGGSVTAGTPTSGGSASGAGGSGNAEGGGGASQAGHSGSGGQMAAGAGGAAGAVGAGAAGASGDAGSGAGDNVEFRACELGAAIPVVTLNRIDRTSSTCLSITIRQSMAGCTLGLAGNDDWCLARAVVSSDVAACEAQQAPGDAIDAEAATGTFSVALPAPIQIDVDLVFPSGTDFPEMQHVEMAGCAPDCQPNDCRQ